MRDFAELLRSLLDLLAAGGKLAAQCHTAQLASRHCQDIGQVL